MFIEFLFNVYILLSTCSSLTDTLINFHLDCCSLLPSLSGMSNSVTPRTAACQASLSFTISLSLLKLLSIESVMPFNHLILCHLLFLLPCLSTSLPIKLLFNSKIQLRLDFLREVLHWLHHSSYLGSLALSLYKILHLVVP